VDDEAPAWLLYDPWIRAPIQDNNLNPDFFLYQGVSFLGGYSNFLLSESHA
jgi:hypothetical protein